MLSQQMELFCVLVIVNLLKKPISCDTNYLSRVVAAAGVAVVVCFWGGEGEGDS